MTITRTRSRVGGLALLGMALALAWGCSSRQSSSSSTSGSAPASTATRGGGLTGAGATFPYPLYSKWFDEYGKSHPGAQINYQSIGSGGGIRQITERTLDFGASDAPMNEDQLAKAPGILHIPTVLGAVVVTYNLPGVAAGLKLDGETLAGIFSGAVTRWNDPRIKGANPGVNLPDLAISVVHRSDGSGTTNIFTDYLSHVSPSWSKSVGKGTAVNWPVGLGAKGNEGVAGQVRNLNGTMGYVELAYAVTNNLPYAFLKNAAGSYIEPTVAATTAAAEAAAQTMPADLRVSIVNSTGKQAYPICGFTYLLVYQDQTDARKGQILANFLWWAIHEGQQFAPPLLYAPLPAAVVKLDEEKIRSIRSGGKPLLP